MKFFRQHPGPNDAGLAFMLDMGTRNGGKLMRMWQGPVRAAVVVHHPDSIKVALKGSDIPKALQGHGAAYSLIRPWLGQCRGSDGGSYHRARQIPGFLCDMASQPSLVKVKHEAAGDLFDFLMLGDVGHVGL